MDASEAAAAWEGQTTVPFNWDNADIPTAVHVLFWTADLRCDACNSGDECSGGGCCGVLSDMAEDDSDDFDVIDYQYSGVYRSLELAQSAAADMYHTDGTEPEGAEWIPSNGGWSLDCGGGYGWLVYVEAI